MAKIRCEATMHIEVDEVMKRKRAEERCLQIRYSDDLRENRLTREEGRNDPERGERRYMSYTTQMSTSLRTRLSYMTRTVCPDLTWPVSTYWKIK